MENNFKIIVTGDYACFTPPEAKIERYSYDVPTPSAMKGLIKAVYWKPAIDYIIDKIVVFNPIKDTEIRLNEVKNKVNFTAMKDEMLGKRGKDPCIYTSTNRTQRANRILKDVKYGIEFHIVLRGVRNKKPDECLNKHIAILNRRLNKGQHHAMPFLGMANFPVNDIYPVDEFNYSNIHEDVLKLGDYNLGMMVYDVVFTDGGIPINGDYGKPKFSNEAYTKYYRPHMINGVIDVKEYFNKR